MTFSPKIFCKFQVWIMAGFVPKYMSGCDDVVRLVCCKQEGEHFDNICEALDLITKTFYE